MQENLLFTVCNCVCLGVFTWQNVFLYILGQLSRWMMVGDEGRRGSDGEGGLNKGLMEGRMPGETGEAKKRGDSRGHVNKGNHKGREERERMGQRLDLM